MPLNNTSWHLVLQAPEPSFTSAAVRMTQIGWPPPRLVRLADHSGGVLHRARDQSPLMQLSDVADRISLGELNAKIRINRRDEIGDLAEALRRMQVSLQTAIERLRAKRNT